MPRTQLLPSIQDDCYFAFEAVDIGRALDTVLRTRHSDLPAFVGNSRVPLALFDLEVRYVAANAAWAVQFDLAEPGLAGRSFYDVLPETTWFWRGVHQRALRGERLTAAGDRFTRADGRVQWLNWAVWPWYCAEHTIGGLVIFAENLRI